MAEWKELGNKAKNLTLAGLGKARDLGQSAKLNLDNVSEEENRSTWRSENGSCPSTPQRRRDMKPFTVSWKRWRAALKPTRPG